MHPLKPLARDLRKNQTIAEAILWKHLRNRRVLGLKFKRQVPIGKYIVDFVCVEKKLVIELDGGHHNEELHKTNDDERTEMLKHYGYHVIRFWNKDVINNFENVMEEIYFNVRVSSP